MTAVCLGLSLVAPGLSRSAVLTPLRESEHLPEFSYFTSEVCQQHFASKAINKSHDYRKCVRKESVIPCVLRQWQIVWCFLHKGLVQGMVSVLPATAQE